MDRVVGRVVEAVEELHLRDETLFLFTSDNGTPKRVTVEANGREFQGGKGELTEAGTHVPLIASWPGHVPSGRVCEALIDFSDFVPTLAELAGASLPEDRHIDGVSFAPQLLGSDESHRRWIYTRWQDREWVRSHDWKLYGSGELYHVADDVKEQRPLDPDRANDAAKAARTKLQQAFKVLGVREGEPGNSSHN